MSRIGKALLVIPQGVKVNVASGSVCVEGPKGKLQMSLSALVTVENVDKNIVIKPVSDTKQARSMHGTTRALINNMIIGVSRGFKKELDIVGVGYKAQMKGNNLVLNMGFSHPVDMAVPQGLKVAATSATHIVVEGIDRQLVGEFTAKVRRIYPPEPYKGKGIRYSGEEVRKKLGKALAK